MEGVKWKKNKNKIQKKKRKENYSAILSQKYSGKNFSNNKIDVDFKNKTVKFYPLSKLYSDSKAKRRFIIYIGVVSVILSFYVMMPFAILFNDTHWIGYAYGITMVLPCCLNLWIYYLLLKYNTSFQQFIFPKANKVLSKITWLLISWSWKKDRKEVLNPEAIINKKVILPYFSNISLDYELSGDFATYIKRIYISNLYLTSPCSWYCIFEFTRHPKYGNLIVKYY